MADTLYPSPSRELSDIRKRLAPDIHDVFQAFSQKGSRTARCRARQSSSSRSPSRTSRSAPVIDFSARLRSWSRAAAVQLKGRAIRHIP